MIHRRISRITILLAILAASAACDNRTPAEKIIGVWETNETETPAGPTQLIYEFTDDGTLRLSGMIGGESISSSCEYTITDGKLELIGAGLTTRTEDGLIQSGTVDLEFRGDRIYLKEGDKTRVVLKPSN